jgi:hypothetical protein
MAALAAFALGAPAAVPAEGASQPDRLSPTMDRVFGPGHWRETSGYRSAAEEDQLRREGAGTVPAGRLSRHSMGTRAAPGAYDVVVSGMSQPAAAARLRREAAFTVLAEGAHGPEGPHLHVVPGGARLAARAARAPAAPMDCSQIHWRVLDGRQNPTLTRCLDGEGD